MSVTNLVVVISALLVVPALAAIISDSKSVQQEIFSYDLKIRILERRIMSECPAGTTSKSPDSKGISGSLNDQLQAKKLAYSALWSRLLTCHNDNVKHDLSPTIPTTTTPLPTTTPPPTPLECLTATNFTEPWRRDHNGSNVKPGGPHSRKGYACDVHNDTAWFRFTSEAGNKMLDSCPAWRSCGGEYSYWSGDKMPTEVGVAKFVKTSYTLESGKCKESVWPMEVIRCSTHSDHDFIYKMYYRNSAANHTCSISFCGMV